MIADHVALLTDRLFECQAVQFGAFKLKLHEKNPDAPLSPIYFNLRTADNPKPGPLTPELVGMIGKELYRLESQSHSELTFDCVAGIPNAGDPLAVAFSHASSLHPPVIRLAKQVGSAGRSITEVLEGEVRGATVLLIDDLITRADTKLEAARAIEAAGGTVAGFIVLIDREQGGIQHIQEDGYTVHSVFTVSELLAHYVAQGFISPERAEEVTDYIHSRS